MKELSIEKKAKAYDEAIERANSLLSSNQLGNAWIYKLLPELKENEDEKIRKAIIQFFELQDDNTTYSLIPKKDIITWLEKQGEQKSADKVEPKFKTGTYVVYLNDTYMLEDDGKHYILTAVKKNASTPVVHIHYGNEDYTMRKWNIADAKDGDVLRIRNLIFIFQEITNNNVCHKDAAVAYCSYEDNDDGFGVCGPDCITDLEIIIPATKEQRDLLFQKMYEAGYTWDAEKKELKKIGQKKEDASELTEFEAELFSMMSDAWQGYLRGEEVNIAEIVKEHSSELLERANEQKPAEWSKEDEEHLERILKELENQCQRPLNRPYSDKIESDYNWLKSLKDRVQPKVELTQLDKNILEAAIAFVEQNNHFCCWRGVDKHTVLSALHLLRLQNTWKPSELQIEALESATENCAYSEYQDCLRELIEQLKKLKE